MENNNADKEGIPASANKIQEYIERVKKGESIDSFQLPPKMREAVEQGLNKETTGSAPERALIPKQYEGLDSETLDFIWTIPEYLDPEKTRQEQERKNQALEHVRNQELLSKQKEERQSQDQQKIDDLRKELGAPEDNLQKKVSEYEDSEHQRAIGIYNTMVDIAAGAREGLKEDLERKVRKYADEILSGKDENYVLQGLPEKWREAVQEQVRSLRENPPSIEEVIEQKRQQIRTDLENLTQEEIRQQIKLRNDLVYWEHKGSLSDDLFSVGKGQHYEDRDGNFYSWEIVDGEIGSRFDAHGIAKTDQLNKLLNLLDNGIDTTHGFYTAPFELPEEVKAGAGAGLGTGDGTAYKDGIAVLTSGYRQSLSKDGIKHVFLNDVYQSLKDPLQKTYPQYQFHLLSEQKEILENEASAQKNN